MASKINIDAPSNSTAYQSTGAATKVSARIPTNTPLVDNTGKLTQAAVNSFAQLNLLASKLLLNPVTYSQLPTPTTAPVPGGVGNINTSQVASWGTLAFVTDATVNTIGSVLSAGGGSYDVLAFCNGQNWIIIGGVIPAAPGPVTFADLPASPTAGMTAFVSDSTTNATGAWVTAGGGSYLVPVYYDGSQWICMAFGETGPLGTQAAYSQLNPVLFANLPPSPGQGAIATISDCTTKTWGAVVSAGGGSYCVLIRFNGTAWTVVGI